MKEKLIIHKFAGITHLEIELNRINILIGPQATGKSITAKLFFYFKSFINEIYKGVENSATKREIDKNYVNRFINYFPKETWPKNKFSIDYFLDDTWMRISKELDRPLKFEYSEDFKIIIRNARKIYKKEQEKYHSNKGISHFRISRNYSKEFNSFVKEKFSTSLTYSQLFIPAGRSFFSNIQSNIFSFLSSDKSIDPFLVEFGSFYERFKPIITKDFEISDSDKKIDKKFETLINEILNSNYLREQEKDFLVHKDKRKVNLFNASSGQQEILPLLLVLKILFKFKLSETGTTLYIEEPEAHLFPNSQKNIIQLLAKVFNSKSDDFQIIVTTHSPYILTSFNNLMYAGSLFKKADEEKKNKIFKIIPKEEIIDPSMISAFSLELNGEKKNLIDKETKLISQNILDNVSNEISVEFGKLLDIEY